jgi:hypothetical protein
MEPEECPKYKKRMKCLPKFLRYHFGHCLICGNLKVDWENKLCPKRLKEEEERNEVQ